MDREAVGEIKRHFDFVFEGLRTELKAAAKAVGRLSERIGALATPVDAFDTGKRTFEMRAEAGCQGPDSESHA